MKVEPVDPAIVRQNAAGKVRQAMSLIGIAAGGPLREVSSSEYFELNQIWHQCSAVAERLESQTPAAAVSIPPPRCGIQGCSDPITPGHAYCDFHGTRLDGLEWDGNAWRLIGPRRPPQQERPRRK